MEATAKDISAPYPLAPQPTLSAYDFDPLTASRLRPTGRACCTHSSVRRKRPSARGIHAPRAPAVLFSAEAPTTGPGAGPFLGPRAARVHRRRSHPELGPLDGYRRGLSTASPWRRAGISCGADWADPCPYRVTRGCSTWACGMGILPSQPLPSALPQAAPSASTDGVRPIDGMPDKIRPITADARQLSIAPSSSEAVASGPAVRNIHGQGWRRVIREMAWVLKPWATDIDRTPQCARTLMELRWTNGSL